MSIKGPSVLSISYDECLLCTRQWILETAGLNVISALGFTEARTHSQADNYDLVIVCHSIPSRDKRSLVEIIRQRHCGPILALRCPGTPPLAGVDESIETLEGPEVLLSAVLKLLNRRAASAPSAMH